MPPPDRALLDLAAGRPVPPAGDPTELVRSAIEHRVHGLLWEEVRRGAVELPERDRTALLYAALTSRARQQPQWTALERVHAELAELGIEVATFKGVTSEARWYDRMGERPSSDVDVLVDPGSLHRIGEVLTRFEPAHPLAEGAARLVAAHRLQSVQVGVEGVSIDIHLDLFKLGVPSRQRHEIWARTEPFTLPSGATVRVLDPETALVHFLLHLNKDRFRWLLGFADVVRLLAREEVDWAAVRSLARGDGLGVPVALSLRTVLETLAVDGPELDGTDGWRAAVWRRLWADDVRLQGDIGILKFRHRQAWLPMLAEGRTAEAAGLWVRKLFPVPELVASSNAGVRGGYVRRLAVGRVARAAERRREAGRLRRRSGGA